MGMSLLAGLACGLLVLALFAPRHWAWPAIDIPDLHGYPEVNRAADVLKQLDEPFTTIANPSNRVIEWRLLVPLLANLLGFSRELLFAVGPVGCLVVLAAVFHLLRRETARTGLAVLGAISIGAASWFFISTGWLTYQDSWLVAGSLALVFARRMPALVAACVLTPWIDERFLLALPLLALARWLPSEAIDRTLRREALAIAIATAPYVLIRVGALLLGDGDQSGDYVGDQLAWLTDMPAEARDRLLPGLWQSLRGAWLLVAAWALAPWLAGRRRVAALASVGLGLTILLNLFVAGDLSRSATTLVPLAVAGLIALARLREREAWLVAGLAVTIGLLAPARHVVASFEIPIRSARVEADRAAAPPPEFDPKARAWRALEREKSGDVEGALNDLDAAVVLDPGEPQPLLLRGRVLERARRLPEARAAFAAAAACAEPGSESATAAATALGRLSAGP